MCKQTARFGKSFAAKMLCAYYDKNCDSRELFEGLEISKDATFKTYLNKYLVIYLDITLFTSRTSDINTVVRDINNEVTAEVTSVFKDIEAGKDLAETLLHVTEKTGKHTELAKLIRNSEYLLEATLNRDEEAVAAAIEEAHRAGTAPTFYNNEHALRSVVQSAYISCVDEFLKMEELPSGHGYADVVFFPKKATTLPMLLVELKWNKTDEGAINQIKRNDYPQAIKDYGGEILLIGINYDAKSKKHTCVIEAYKKN